MDHTRYEETKRQDQIDPKMQRNADGQKCRQLRQKMAITIRRISMGAPNSRTSPRLPAQRARDQGLD